GHAAGDAVAEAARDLVPAQRRGEVLLDALALAEDEAEQIAAGARQLAGALRERLEHRQVALHLIEGEHRARLEAAVRVVVALARLLVERVALLRIGVRDLERELVAAVAGAAVARLAEGGVRLGLIGGDARAVAVHDADQRAARADALGALL